MIMLEELVEKHYDSLNENDLYIWQYIHHHKSECQKMSIQELARICNVSHTSILRFCKKLELDGYSELKVHLKWNQEKKVEIDPTMVKQIAKELRDTVSLMEDRDLESILKLIYDAKNVFVYGGGIVQYHAAEEFRKDFAYGKKIFHVVEDGVEIDTTLHYATKEDVFIIISLSGDNETCATLAKALKQMHIKTIGIALDRHNLLSKYCDTFLGFTSTPFNTGFYDKHFTCTGHFFIIVSMLFARYVEYCHQNTK